MLPIFNLKPVPPFEHDEAEHGKKYRYNDHDQKSIRVFLQGVRDIHPVQAGNQGR